jgi:predicted RecB family nuclease
MINDEIIESFVNCKYKAYRKFSNEHGIKTEFELLQQDQLASCKTEIFKRLLEKHGKNKLLEGYSFGKNRRMPDVDILVQPTLSTETYQISFDAIEIIPLKNSSSKRILIPILISQKEKISRIEKLSIAIKCVILSQACGTDYEFGRIIYGPELKTAKFKTEPFLTEAKKRLTELDKISKGESYPLIFYKNHCKICEFQEICEKELVEKDSLGLLHRMGEKDIKRYNNKGIFTVKQLSYTFRPRRRGKRVKTKQHLYYHSLRALAIREQKVYLYDKIDMPDVKIKIYIDMEGNSEGSFVYLIGILVVEKGQCKKYSLWADNFDDEKEIFGECIKILNGLDNAHIFYYGKYESRIFKRMRNCNLPKKVKNLLMNKSTNMLTVIYSNLYFPTYSNSLKEIGKYLGCTWSAPNASGIQSIVWRRKWEHSKGTKLKDTLIRYNYEDCVGLKIITDFIYSNFDDTGDSSNKKLEKISLVEEMKSYYVLNIREIKYFFGQTKISKR